MLTLRQYTHHPKCPHLITTLQRVVNEVSMPMWMPGPCSGMTLILVRGLGGPRAGVMAAPSSSLRSLAMSTIMAAFGESRWGRSYFQTGARTSSRLRGAVGVPGR